MFTTDNVTRDSIDHDSAAIVAIQRRQWDIHIEKTQVVRRAQAPGMDALPATSPRGQT